MTQVPTECLSPMFLAFVPKAVALEPAVFERPAIRLLSLDRVSALNTPRAQSQEHDPVSHMFFYNKKFLLNTAQNDELYQ